MNQMKPVTNLHQARPKSPKLEASQLKSLRQRYEHSGIYLYPCNSCSKGIMAFHLRECMNPKCKKINNYYTHMQQVNQLQWLECKKEIELTMHWY